MKIALPLTLYCLLFCLQIQAQTSGSTEVIPPTSAEYFASAMKYKAIENYTEASRSLAKALAADPQNDQYKKEMAELQYLRNAFYEAIPLYEAIVKTDTENIIYLTRLAEMYSMSQQKMKGVFYANKVLKLNPTDGQTNKILAKTYFDVQYYPKAITQYLLAERVFPMDKEIPHKLANCYAQLGKFADAMQYYDRCIELEPNNTSIMVEAGEMCYDANNFKLANVLFQDAENKGYTPSKSFYDTWALIQVEMKNYNLALTYYGKAKEFAPYDKDINLSIAETYMKKGDYSKSREVLDELLEMNPNDADVIYTKGMTYFKAGNTEKAEQFFNQAFEINPALKSLRTTKSSF